MLSQILPGVFTWHWFSERHGYDFNGYLIHDAGGNLVIDPVEMSGETQAELVREGVARILVTNRNHTRAADKLRALTGARVAIHPDDAHFAAENNELRIDESLRAGEHIGPLTAIAVPGKSPGELAFHWPARRILIVGDACVGNPPGGLALLPAKVIDDGVQLRRSLARVAEELDFETLLVGDGVPILTDARQVLRALVMGF